VSPSGRQRVPVAVMQDAFHRSGRSARQVALVLGWDRGGWPDARRVLRSIGLASESRKASFYHPSRTTAHRAWVWHSSAVALIDAMGLSPGECGL
jgi:hypothetical protein